MSAAPLRAAYVPGDPLVLPHAWDAGTARLAELGVARVSLGHFLHAEMMDALSARLGALRTGS
jgi:2-methylisocitrate lyase-like PEP mutase family enzyme